MVAAVDILSKRPLRPLRRVEYDKLVAMGALDGEKVELLRGVMVAMSPTGNAHIYAVQRLGELLFALVSRAEIRTQQAFAASDDSEPEPDIALVPRADYLDDHPRTAFLLIEVADSSLRSDRTDKQLLYAESRVPEYWIVNLVENVIEIFRDPTPTGYAAHEQHGRGARVSPLAFPDLAIAVDDVLPPKRA
jgi:Uma2 family endonuclease